MNITMDQITKELIDKGIRPSIQRIKVFEYIKKHRTHPTVDEIYANLIREIPTLSKTTIYNTLNTLIEANLIRVLTIEENETRYDTVTHSHGHFKCKSCGNIFDFDVNFNLLGIEELDDFRINEKDIFLKGICPKCNSVKDNVFK